MNQPTSKFDHPQPIQPQKDKPSEKNTNKSPIKRNALSKKSHHLRYSTTFLHTWKLNLTTTRTKKKLTTQRSVQKQTIPYSLVAHVDEVLISSRMGQPPNIEVGAGQLLGWCIRVVAEGRAHGARLGASGRRRRGRRVAG